MIFISHIAEEREIAIALQELLRATFSGVEVFVSSDLTSIDPGEDWYVAILQGVKMAHVVLVLCSPLSVRREWINYEAGVGDGTGALVIPLVHHELSKSALSNPLSRKQAKSLESVPDLQSVLDSISARVKITLKQPNLQEFVGRLKPLYELIPTAVDAKQIEEDKRRAYSLAVQILSRLWGKYFGGNSLLPGHLWFKRDEHWFEIAKRLGDIGSSGFKPHVSPAQIQSVDEGTLDDAVSILRLYLWSARENPTFAEIQVKHKLPLAAPVKELVESLGFSDDL